VLALWRYLFFPKPLLRKDSCYRFSWTASWLLCVVHVLCAFHFEHHWSHTAGLKHTAEMTHRVVGIMWGGGLYINYVFLTWWGIDVARLWTKNSGGVPFSMHLIAAFMMFNATVVFGPRWWWLPTITLAIAIAMKWRKNHSNVDPVKPF